MVEPGVGEPFEEDLVDGHVADGDDLLGVLHQLTVQLLVKLLQDDSSSNSIININNIKNYNDQLLGVLYRLTVRLVKLKLYSNNISNSIINIIIENNHHILGVLYRLTVQLLVKLL